MKKRGVSGILVMVMLVSILLTAIPVTGAVADGTTITLGAGALTAGNKVYFGNQILWRVLQSGDGKALLISNNTLARIQFNSDRTAADANVWAGSNAQTWCGNYYTNWPYPIEKSAILTTSVTEVNDESTGYFYKGGYGGNYSYGAASLNGEHFFFLSAKEVDTLFTDDDDRKASGADTYWWLRSPSANTSRNAGVVSSVGWVHFNFVDYNYGTRPAFNLNLNSVLFSSLIPSSSNQYKLTLKDDNLIITKANGKNATWKASTITIPYTISGTNATENTKAYIMVTDSAWGEGATVLQYEKLASGTESGTGTFTLASGVSGTWGTNFHVYLLAVNEGGNNKSDYASTTLVELTSVPDHVHSFAYEANGATITAACETPGCDITSGITLTLNAPTSLTYDGSAKAATISGYPDTPPANLAAAPITITYYKSTGSGSTTPDGSALSGAPSDAGSYVAQMTWGEKTASLAFAITKIPQTAPEAPTEANKTSTAVTLVKTDGYQYSMNGTDWQDSNVFDNLAANTEYTFYQRVAGDDTHDPSPASSGTKIKTTQYTLVFDKGDEGASGSMAPVGVSDGDQFKFPDCTFTKPEGKAFIRWEMSGVDGIFVPDETVEISSNCLLNGVITVTAYWDKATSATITTAPEAKDLTYNGTSQKLVTAGTAENGTMKYIIGDSNTTAPANPTADWQDDVPEAIQAGTYYVWYKAVGDKGYSDSEGKCVAAEIKKSESTAATITANNRTYDGTEKPLVTVDDSTLVGGTMKYALGADGTAAPADGWSESVPTGTEAGTYYVWYKAEGDRNHTDTAAACVTVTIDGAEPEYPAKKAKIRTKLTAKGQHGLKVTWKAVENAQGYDIFFTECMQSEDVNKHLYKSVPADRTSEVIRGLTSGKSYKVRVRAYAEKNGEKKYYGDAYTAHLIVGGSMGRYTNVTAVKALKKEIKLAEGEEKLAKVKLTLAVKGKEPLDHGEHGAVWYRSSDPSVATVTKDGTVKGVKPGTCTIEMIANSGAWAKTTVKVQAGPKKIFFRKERYTIRMEKETTLDLKAKLKFEPADARLVLTWKSSDPDIASVDKKGVVTGKKPGEVTITVRTSNKKKVKVTVKVK